MTLVDLDVWSKTIGPFDDRHYCGKDLTVADVKRAVATLSQRVESATTRLRAAIDALDGDANVVDDHTACFTRMLALDRAIVRTLARLVTARSTPDEREAAP